MTSKPTDTRLRLCWETGPFALGIVFQYFAMVPMRHAGVKAAVKADTRSLIAFEVGLFAWMALSSFVFFYQDLFPDHPVYWFMMQVGMIIGFGTSFPMNWWLITKGLKEKMERRRLPVWV